MLLKHLYFGLIFNLYGLIMMCNQMKIGLMGFANVNRTWSLGRLTFLIAQGLEELNNDVILVSKGRLENSNFNSVQLRRLPKIRGSDILTDTISHQFALWKIDLDVYHMLYPHVSSLLGIVFPQKFKRIVTVHDLKPLILREFLNRKEATNVAILRHVLRRIEGTIAVSHSTRQQLIESLGIDESNVYVVYNPVDPIFRPLKQEERDPSTLQGLGRYIFNVSRFDKLKNPRNLLRAFKLIRRCYDDVNLVIVGSWWSHGKNMINQELGNESDHVIIREFVDNERLVQLYNGSEVFIFPSLYEGFGMPLVEAMACGKAVVTSDRWSMKEIASDVGVLVNPEDPQDIAEKTCKLLSNRIYRENLGIKGLEKAKQFHYLKITKELMHVYESIIKS